MKTSLIIALLFATYTYGYTQPNCEVLKADDACYTSCKTSMKAIRYTQGSHKSQVLFDESIKLCPTFAYAYMQKAVAQLKRGQFIEWKELIDKAVELSPQEYLGYRGWCRIQFLRDYKGAIADIEELKRISNGDIGFCQNGNYHLDIALGLCLKELGELDKAKEAFLDYLNSSYYSDGLFDYFHLGVIEFQLGNLTEAREYLIKQNSINEIAESHYYLALSYERENNQNDFSSHILKAEELYRSEISINDNYTEPIDKIYLIDILKLKNSEFTK